MMRESQEGEAVARTPDINKAFEATVARAIRSEVTGEIRRLERQVAKLSDRLKDLTAVTRSSKAVGSGRAAGPVSPGRRLHGRYIGLLRHLPKKHQVQVRSIRKKQGVNAAIKAAERARK